MNQVTVKYIGTGPKVVNGVTWYPGETWKIDPRLVFSEGIDKLVEIQGAEPPAGMAQRGSETPASAPEEPEEVVPHRKVLPEAVQAPVKSNQPKVKKA